MSERSGIEIDYCPDCRGVWLDRGELDKIIDRSASSSQPQADRYAPPPTNDRRDDRPRHDEPRYAEPRYDRREQQYPRRKRESWLSELFD